MGIMRWILAREALHEERRNPKDYATVAIALVFLFFGGCFALVWIGTSDQRNSPAPILTERATRPKPQALTTPPEEPGAMVIDATKEEWKEVPAPKSDPSAGTVSFRGQTIKVRQPSSSGEVTYGPGLGSSSPSKPKTGGGEVEVKGYTRKDGTYVRPHTRSKPKE